MATVHVLPGVERADLAAAPNGDVVLRDALEEQGLTDVCVCARDRNGDLYLTSSIQDTDRWIGFLTRAVTHLSNTNVVIEPFDTEKND